MRQLKTRRGDTIIEVIIAITIFCLVAIISINLMSSGINSAEGSLELIMARNEIDAQAEALRFIQNSFLAERELDVSQQQYTQLWRRITGSEMNCDPSQGPCGLAIEADQLGSYALTTCEAAYSQDFPDNYIFSDNAFVINTRLVEPSPPPGTSPESITSYFDGTSTAPTYSNLLNDIVVSTTSDRGPDIFREAPLYPRLVFSYSSANSGQTSDDINEDEGTGLSARLYRTVASAEGIWVIAVRGNPDPAHQNQPEFFDFYIRTCWYAPGKDVPSTIGTIVRLYNPEIVE